jgi:hypothetical protein
MQRAPAPRSLSRRNILKGAGFGISILAPAFTTRVMLRRLARLHGLWSKASRCRCGFRLAWSSATRVDP